MGAIIPRSPRAPVDLSRDFHVHTQFSDGSGTAASCYRRAWLMGLRELCFMDHVRIDSDYLSRYVEELCELRKRGEGAGGPRLRIGVEAKILSLDGRLDVPWDLSGVELIGVADHRLPTRNGCLAPREVREALKSGRMSAGDVGEMLLIASCNAVERIEHAHVVHPLSFLPKVGLKIEEAVSGPMLEEFARRMRAAHASVELSERWRCPGPRIAGVLLRAGVELRAGSDAHHPRKIGVYSHLREVSEALARV